MEDASLRQRWELGEECVFILINLCRITIVEFEHNLIEQREGRSVRQHAINLCRELVESS